MWSHDSSWFTNFPDDSVFSSSVSPQKALKCTVNVRTKLNQIFSNMIVFMPFLKGREGQR